MTSFKYLFLCQQKYKINPEQCPKLYFTYETTYQKEFIQGQFIKNFSSCNINLESLK